MLISHKYKFIAFNIPFSGYDFGRLHPICDVKGSSDINSPYYIHTQPLALKNHFQKMNWNWDEYFKFTLVRNPWARIVVRHNNLQPGEEFDERVYYKLPYINHQSWWVYDQRGTQLVDYVCRYENLQQDFQFVCDKIKIRRLRLRPLDNIIDGKHYSEFYTDRLANSVREQFRDDVGNFQYKFERREIGSGNLKTSFDIKNPSESKYKLPDFVIPGFQKCGSTSMWVNLRKHSKISMSRRKELNFFNDPINFQKGIGWYASHFDNNTNLWGEVSPNYLDNLSDRSIDKMGKLLPDAKIIVSVRNPITRAYSAYNHYMQTLDRSKTHNGWYKPGDSFYNNILEEKKNNFINGFVQVGFYITRIEKLLEYYPREQILIISQENLLSNSFDTYGKIFEFLGVGMNESKCEYTDKLNERTYSSGIDEKSLETLETIYAPHNERLFEFLGHEIEEWKVSQ